MLNFSPVGVGPSSNSSHIEYVEISLYFNVFYDRSNIELTPIQVKFGESPYIYFKQFTD